MANENPNETGAHIADYQRSALDVKNDPSPDNLLRFGMKTEVLLKRGIGIAVLTALLVIALGGAKN